jgi:hypothetical protein
MEVTDMVSTDFNKTKNNLHSFMRIFYNIRLKDYYRMLETHLDKKYQGISEDIIKYSDANNLYFLQRTKEEAEINPDVTIGDMLTIARRMDNATEKYDMPYPQKTLDEIAYDITKAIMIDPFYALFETPKGKAVFKEITTNKNRKDD